MHNGTAVDISQIAADVRVALGRVARRLRQAHVPGDLTLSEASVLARLDRAGPATPGELAAGERVRPQAMCTTLAALERRHLVRRAGDQADRRRVLMSATDAGRQLLIDRWGAKSARMAQALATGFTDDEVRRIAEVTPLFERLADML